MYLLDTNVFITAKDNFYPMDYCPAFWNWLEKESARGTIGSIAAVRQELLNGDDNLAIWVRSLPKSFFPDLTSAGVDFLTTMPHRLFCRTPAYQQQALNKFFDCADAQLVAHAKSCAHTIVTFEHSSGGQAKKRVLIPDVCDFFQIPCLSLYEVIRRSGDKFVLDPPLQPLPTQGTLEF